MSELIAVKLGGEIVHDPSVGDLCQDLADLHKSGAQLLVVHGGGPQATQLQRQLGQEPNIVAGRRVTDRAALDVMKMVVAGQLNVDLCAKLLKVGIQPVGLHGASSQAIRAEKRPPTVVAGGGDEPIDFGFVGDVHGVNDSLLRLLLAEGFVPVLACLGADATGQVFNINADIVANQCAKHLRATRLIIVTGAPGVLGDRLDPSTRIPTMTIAQGREAIDNGTVQGGMIPKLTECMRVLEEGSVQTIHIVGALGPGDLLREIKTPGSVGTALLP